MPDDAAPPSNTRRGLVFVLYAQVAAVFLAFAGFALGASAAFLLLFLLVGGLSVVAFYFLWLGHAEPWGAPRRILGWATALFAVTSLLFLILYTAFTTTIRQTNRVEDLRAPVYLMPAFVVVEAATIAVLLWPWSQGGGRTLLRLLVALAVAGGAYLAWDALNLIDDLVLRFGPQLDPRGDAAIDVLEVFHGQVRGAWTLYAVMSRALALGALWSAIGRVAEADTEPATLP